jgi:hypothetical protein
MPPAYPGFGYNLVVMNAQVASTPNTQTAVFGVLAFIFSTKTTTIKG